MKPIGEMDAGCASAIQYVLCDIDDTITTKGKLPAEAYSAMWKLHDRGLSVIPVTGRPAGWCDLIVREWPVRAVVGENGAFVYSMENGRVRTFIHPSVSDTGTRLRLDAVREACLEGVPGCRVAHDQFARRYDLAIDFNEDPPYLGLAAAEKIRNICETMGARAKISSIHVNAWFGDYDKRTMTELFMGKILRETDLTEKCLFFGDSPNDEPMFARFPKSCAVANIRPFVPVIRHLPAYVTAREGGQGFAEAVDHILSVRNRPAAAGKSCQITH